MKNSIKTIAFDADDTLWDNEAYFQEAETQFCALLADYLPKHTASQELFKVEIENLSLYGYGVKSFMLSMIESAIRITGDTGNTALIQKIIVIGQELLQKPIALLPGVEKTLDELKGQYRLVLATKGDLLDQERKLEKSGLLPYFHHIEIMSGKNTQDYQKLLKHLDCRAHQFLMLGNSLKSDILPVLELGGYAAHIPYHITWAHEVHSQEIHHPNFLSLKSIDDILKHLVL